MMRRRCGGVGESQGFWEDILNLQTSQVERWIDISYMLTVFFNRFFLYLASHNQFAVKNQIVCDWALSRRDRVRELRAALPWE